MARIMAKIVGILAILLGLLGLLYLYFCKKDTNWIALAAIGTVLASTWAIFRQGILAWLNKPILNIVGFFEPEPPHLRKVPFYLNGKPLDITYQLSIEIKNTGQATAKNAALHVSEMRRVEDGKWNIQNNWIAAPIKWALDIAADIGRELPTEERNLVSRRPYISNFGMLRTSKPDLFILRTIIMPAGQKEEYEPGEYCFQLTLSAEGAKPVKKYFHIRWRGGCTEDLKEVKEKIRIYMPRRPPK